jgi:hypothetical protein
VSPDADADGVCDDVDNCPSDYNPGQEDGDGDGTGDACDGCGTADADLDGICDALDSCPAVYNPGQENTDGDAEGGDACDITVTSPLDGDVTCDDPPPTITWTPEVYDRFRVIIATNRRFNKKVTSGKTLLTGTSWTVGPRKWSRICARTNARLHIRVMGRIAGTKTREYSTPSVITVK